MIFADKLIQLRKKSGWTQEELAQQMHVSRQSVSKWEGAQSVPDLEKMVQLSRLFHVTTDYLLKDEEGEPEPAPGEDPGESLRRVSLEEASAFLEAKQRSAGPIAFATMLCVLSPIGLILLAAMSEVPKYGIPENAAPPPTNSWRRNPLKRSMGSPVWCGSGRSNSGKPMCGTM